jgi:HAD superfamily hydrolase (TIGR01509 family)
MKLKPAAILFDMDGVLVDSLDSWWESLNAALKAYNIKEISRAEFIKKFWGHDLQYNMEKMGISYKVITFCNNVYAQHVNSIKVYPDTKDTLSKFHKYKKGVITNTPRDCAVQILKKYNLKDYFNIILTSDDVTNGKPDPELVLKACSLLGVKPSEVVLVGDTKSDIEAGKAAGCKVIGKKIIADYTIDELSDLTEFIDL